MPPEKLTPQFDLRSFLFVTCSIAVIMLFADCTPKPRRSFLPNIPGYDETQKEVVVLNKLLLEISGVFFMKDGRIAANNDEHGRIYFLNLPDGAIDIFKFSGKGDYEDIVLVDTVFYLIESKGNIHRIENLDVTTHKEFKFPKKKIEFESLYHDKKANKLVLVSKDHSEDVQGIIAYSFDLATHTFSQQPYYFIPMKQIFFALKNNIAECKPSAAAIHPVTGKLYMVASIGKVILECTSTGKVERAYKINPAQFPQPEGITFAPNGDMYISNEGLNGKATILKFPYQSNPTVAEKN
jgi:hypothetical protein